MRRMQPSKGFSIKFSAIASGGVLSSFPSNKQRTLIHPIQNFSFITSRPNMADPDGSSGGGGYYTYQCCYWNEQNCGGWVYQNGDACAECQVFSKSLFTLHLLTVTHRPKDCLANVQAFPTNHQRMSTQESPEEICFAALARDSNQSGLINLMVRCGFPNILAF